MSYLRNAWYVAGFADELPLGGMLARTLLDEPLVFFRQPDGTVAALMDRCPHRFAPLSQGKLVDNGQSLQCGYHGLRFNASGNCIHNPHGVTPKATCVRSYNAVEKDQLIWWWAGETGAADVALIPDYAKVTSAPADATIRGYLPTQCHYELLVDNIMDLTHVDFLHPESLGSGALSRTKPEVTDLSERTARITWSSSGDLAPAAFDMHLPKPGQPTEQWTEVTWTAPSMMLLQVGAAPQGEPRENGIDTLNLHLATPESAGRTHYWYWSSRNFAVSHEANAMITKVIEYAFTQEDKPMLEAQQRNIGILPFSSLKPVLLAGDAGSVRCRRKLKALIDGASAAT